MAVVGDRDPSILADIHVDKVAAAGERLVHRVVDDLIDQMVKPALIGAPDIHARAASYRFEAFENLNVGGCVRSLLRPANGFYQYSPLVPFVL